MAAPVIYNAYAVAPGSEYWGKTSIEATDWGGSGQPFPSIGFEVAGFQLLKTDYTGTDPLSVTLDDPNWIPLASVGPRNVPGWVASPSYIATRWFYRAVEPGTLVQHPIGSTTAGLWTGTYAEVSGVVPVPLDVHTDSSTTSVPVSYTSTPSASGVVISHFLNTLFKPFGAASCTAGTPITIGGSGSLSFDWLAFTLEERRTKGIFVGAVVF